VDSVDGLRPPSLPTGPSTAEGRSIFIMLDTIVPVSSGTNGCPEKSGAAQGNLKGVAFRDGINGQGGMPECFRMADHGPRKLRTATVCGLVFDSASDTVPPVEEYLGDEILQRIERVLGGQQIEVIGRFTQALPNNWKLYAENARDSYHALLLHLFFTTFELNKLSMKGGLIPSAASPASRGLRRRGQL
jgi:phenylpropionate dioxygenase-like ring-hydroxylating dioxygenase large terminal subunit